MSKDLSERVTNLEAWVEVVMRTLATCRLDDILSELDEARCAYDEEDEMTQEKPVTSAERQQPSISQREKASRWDNLIRMLRRPEIRDVSVRHLSSHRRAVMMLLASREELPATLTAELKSYKFTLDTLYLEAIGGFEDVDGIINYLPTYITESAVGQLCQPDSTDNEACS